MQIVVAENGGFCFGVSRAVQTAMELPEGKNYILGELIHNEQVVAELAERGLKTISDVDEAENGATLLIRTHGVGRNVFERAKAKNLRVVDCTCPFVEDIQKIVADHYAAGYGIVIIGNAEHPEVKGINGWCDEGAFITDEPFDPDALGWEKLCIVVQTTFSLEKFEKILKNLPKNCGKTLEIYKTICYTTIKRQNEARKISSECDACLVLGGNNSNNTQKLYEICAENCLHVFKASSPSEVDYKSLKKFNKVGIVVGASTPPKQFQEVISGMENTEVKATLNEETATAAEVETSEKKVEAQEASAGDTMEAAVAQMDNTAQKFKLHQIIKVAISQAADDGLSVYIPNTKKEVLLLKSELIDENYDKETYSAKIGDEIDTMVIGLNPLVLSEKAVLEVKKEDEEIEKIKNGEIFTITATGFNKGGLTGNLYSYQVFVPSSQIRIGFVKDLDKFVGKTLRLKAEKIENEGRRKQIVGSQRVILEAEKEERDKIRAEKEEAFFNSIEVGDIVKGTTQRFAEFGAFVNVNGFDCLAHISDLSWTKCKKCSDVLELNKMYEFKILKIDKENKKVSIGYKQLQPKPWELIADKYHAGDVVKGKVVRIVSFGAFVEVEPEVDGLVHVSQISNEWLENPTSALKVGEEVEAKILEIDTEKEKMTLSIKALLPESEVVKKPRRKIEEEKEGADAAAKPKKTRIAREDDDLPREWQDDANGGASIAEILANTNK